MIQRDDDEEQQKQSEYPGEEPTQPGPKLITKSSNTTLVRSFLSMRNKTFLFGNKKSQFGFCRVCQASTKGSGPKCSVCKHPAGRRSY